MVRIQKVKGRGRVSQKTLTISKKTVLTNTFIMLIRDVVGLKKSL